MEAGYFIVTKGALPLALSRDTSNGPDSQDWIQALNAFETSNRCRVIVTIRSCGLQGESGVWYEAKAITQPSAGVVPALLASVQLSCGSLNSRTTAQAIFNLLYQLDYELGAREFAMLGK
jgi:hypothetical protein